MQRKKLAALAPILLEGRDELSADFRQYYGLSLDALLESGGFDEAVALTVQLPHQSRTVKRLHPELAWDEATHMLANLCDQLANIAYGMGGKKGKKPTPIPRPKAKKKRKAKKRLNIGRERVDALLFGKRS